jgi:choline dehydrogenase
MRRYVDHEHFPGPSCKTKKDYEEVARSHARSSYHPVGTCKIGTDEMAVVDTKMRVRGLDGLRVCDSSAMPRIISSNTNATTIAMAERVAGPDPRQQIDAQNRQRRRSRKKHWR